MATASSVVAYYKKEKKKVTREELKPVGRGCRGVAGPEQKQQLHKCFYFFQRSNMLYFLRLLHGVSAASCGSCIIIDTFHKNLVRSSS